MSMRKIHALFAQAVAMAIVFLTVEGSTVAQGLGPQRPVLYDNTIVCTPGTHRLAVGGSLSNAPALSLRDWFTTDGGAVAGWDLFFVNCGPGAVENTIADLSFFTGTDAEQLGEVICDIENCAFFTTTIAPVLPPIPVRCDPVTGEPHVIRVSVDYLSNTYTIEDVTDGVVLEHVTELGSAFFGRSSFRLPAGKIGVHLRLGSEASICAGGEPQAGPVLAGGGSGNEDGLHIISAEECDPAFFPLVCDDAGWNPGVPCTGGTDCDLDLPHYGIALTLYAGPGEDDDGNNEIDTADEIDVDPPSPCTGGLVTVHGFVGDNGQPIGPDIEIVFFDCDGDEDVDFADFGCFQRCFGLEVSPACIEHDQDQDGDVDIDDFAAFLDCHADPNLPDCRGEIPPEPILLQDIDLYAVGGLEAGWVLSALVEGSVSPIEGPLWDPALRIFADSGSGIEQLSECDDFARFSLNALTTVEVPEGADTLYVGISSAANAEYDPQDPTTIMILDPEEAGGYALSVAITDPLCVEDDASGGINECYETKHEPDDTIADAIARGGLEQSFIFGAIGDGAFAELGQDFDLYQIRLDGTFVNFPDDARRITARVQNLQGAGFDTVFDLVMALYDSAGELVAVADQHSTVTQSGNDQSRPSLGANVFGSAFGGDGIYYLAIFGTDRGLFNDNCDPVFATVPPSFLNFPHGDGVGCTEACDLRPFVGGRVNKPGDPLVGCSTDPKNDPPATLQCYRIDVLTNNNPLFFVGIGDACDVNSPAYPDGNDSIPDACDVLITQDRLSMNGEDGQEFYLGNGPYGGAQGDVDFFEIPVLPGQLISVNMADAEQPPANDHPVHVFLALFGPDGCVIAEHDYLLERPNDEMFDGVSDEMAATIVATVPSEMGEFIYLMVGIDAGNFDISENTPVDALRPGMTQSRRFETNIWQPRLYVIGVAVLEPSVPPAGSSRMFVAPRRGSDEIHTECFDGDVRCYPPILEVEPATGKTVKVLEASAFFLTYRNGSGPKFPPDQFVSANPTVAYDGSSLFVTVERCDGSPFCSGVDHLAYRINPDLETGDPGFVTALGEIEGLAPDSIVTGLVEIDGFLYALDTTTNVLRFWDKTSSPSLANGSTMPLTAPAGEFDDVDGDLGTDGALVYAGCAAEGQSVGICTFEVDPQSGVAVFAGIVPDPVTNHGLIPGPRLGGLDVVDGNVMVASDRNGPVVEHRDMSTDAVTGFELAGGFLLERLSVR